MAFILSPNTPRPLRGDQIISEQAKVIFSMGVTAQEMEDTFNDFLVTARDDPEHYYLIRDIDVNVTLITGGGLITALTTVQYTLVGSLEPPYILSP